MLSESCVSKNLDLEGDWERIRHESSRGRNVSQSASGCFPEIVFHIKKDYCQLQRR